MTYTGHKLLLDDMMMMSSLYLSNTQIRTLYFQLGKTKSPEVTMPLHLHNNLNLS